MTRSKLPPLLVMEDMEAMVLLSDPVSPELEAYLVQCEAAVRRYFNHGIAAVSGLTVETAGIALARALFYISAWKYGIDTKSDRYKLVLTKLSAMSARLVFKDAPSNYRTQDSTFASTVARYGYILAWHIISKEMKKAPGTIDVLQLDEALAKKASVLTDNLELLIEYPNAAPLINAGVAVEEVRYFIDKGIDLDIALATLNSVDKPVDNTPDAS